MSRTNTETKFDTFANFPTVWGTNLLYITTDTNKLYRWTWSAYQEVWWSASAVDAITSSAVIANNVIVRWDWGSRWVQDSSILIDDADNVSWILSLNVSGGHTVNITTLNAATYDLLVTDYIVNVTYTSTWAVTSLTLPTAQTISWRIIIIKDAWGLAWTNNITIDTEWAQTIDWAATAVISWNYDSISLYSDWTNWYIF